MEFIILAKVGFFVKAIVNTGYVIATSYMAKTGWQYVEDYKTSVANEKEVK
ncbi:hypothetical protein PQE74_gp225 [Bacillus phage vB_BanS_Chewbecca]|jgi:hypothetical protein|uniref:Uncharacterized protein n=5 Tax=Tsamsavirus TaxID=3044849 RepID=A0AAE9CDW8_9CAUD|nr:hypothetical protein X915_gp262 [Bacillus phage vB_BanS-Tsamsa]YP_010680645.1 hypothetical protein PQE71_gp243 [Bacillus phage Izhevsk]YP_010680677.1 hypothetical protein PQE72_gp017 [Bacillus phage vB_BanS_Skywalker]YP_010681127.1 hypothetical protein PQE73_gp236 [Bacillus phage vB_BanS_MrDarsey]YP_010681365.1 hypothetical protein PQE74_gp225 [Bacillus phage vB_BanS_Chewbecca]UUV46673.1 hypothetical protein [Bacillus phage vB_BanS-Thrax4]AGI11976.1 hypothetical protein [Bacillus phage vB_